MSDIKQFTLREVVEVTAAQHKRITQAVSCLKYLAAQMREDIPEEQGSRHLWDAVEDAEHFVTEWET